MTFLDPCTRHGKSVALTPKEIKRLMSAWEAGTTQLILAKRFGLSTQTVRQYIRKEQKRHKKS